MRKTLEKAKPKPKPATVLNSALLQMVIKRTSEISRQAIKCGGVVPQ